MIRLSNADVFPLSDFKLKWRWTDGRWDRLSHDILASIRPIRQETLEEIWPHIARLLEAERDREPYRRLDISGRTAQQVAVWLLNTGADRGEDVLVIWDQETAVVTSWGTFADAWDVFCYPSSDDVTVVPVSGDWWIEYRHWEELLLFRGMKGFVVS